MVHDLGVRISGAYSVSRFSDVTTSIFLVLICLVKQASSELNVNLFFFPAWLLQKTSLSAVY
jgi:hypothetical protein